MKLVAGSRSDKPAAIARVARSLAAASPRRDLPGLIVLTDPVRLPDPLRTIAALPPGSGLIWRAYDTEISRNTLMEVAHAARARRCLLLLAGHGESACPALIGGVHLPERDIIHSSTEGRFSALRRARPGLVVTAAAHSHRAIIAAARAGVDAVFISPVFATESHPDTASLGIIRFARLARAARDLGLMPYALGGIASHNAPRLRGSGATGIGGIGFVRHSL